MNGSEIRLYGLMAEFRTHEEVVNAAQRAYAEGYRHMDAYSPFPVEGLAEALGRAKNRLPLVVLAAGVVGGLGGFLMQDYAMAWDYPLNIGGKPLHSWPAFIPITFELTVLSAAVAGVVGLFFLTRLPEPHHPVFNVPEFERASLDRFFLCIETADPRFDRDEVRRFLLGLKPDAIREVPE